MVGGLVSAIPGALAGLGYPGIAAVVGLESAGLPLPGEAALLAASYLAVTGHFSLLLVIGSAALGAVVGDSLGYFIGRKGGRRFLQKYGRYAGITPEKLAKADGYFVRHGGKTVFFGRFVALLRVLAGPLAGASNMPYRKFLIANVTGAVTWAAVMGALGFFFGGPVVAILGSLGVWALVALGALLVLRFALGRVVLARRRTRRRGFPRRWRPWSSGAAGPAISRANARTSAGTQLEVETPAEQLSGTAGKQHQHRPLTR